MLNVKKLAGAALIATSGLVFSIGMAYSPASATDATTATSVVTEELCTWYMLGAPSSIALAPAVAGTEYEGDAIEVSKSFDAAENADLNVYSSGNVTEGTRTTYGNCTFYSAPQKPTVTMSIADADFSATAAIGGVDAPMDFSASTGNEFKIDQTSSCAVKWTATDLALKTGSLSATFLTIPTLADVDARVTGTGNDRCSADFTIKINIPANKTPTYPGQSYSWSGPAFTTALTTSAS
jgi:hypothetical protein